MIEYTTKKCSYKSKENYQCPNINKGQWHKCKREIQTAKKHPTNANVHISTLTGIKIQIKATLKNHLNHYQRF